MTTLSAFHWEVVSDPKARCHFKCRRGQDLVFISATRNGEQVSRYTKATAEFLADSDFDHDSYFLQLLKDDAKNGN